MYFLTVWLKEKDSDELKENIMSLIEKYVKEYCNSEILDKKLPPSGRRITVSLPCDGPDYNCTQQNVNINDLINKLESKTNRVARAKARCIED
ncbi:hypothetical protein LCGC14_0832980 [marine sediment metagenome]|uniref:Uncharacterized protein n=1 Tax=marine sediment metagenome TaxID=412755 RepID=A0A0F9PFF0_9ZZZZ